MGDLIITELPAEILSSIVDILPLRDQYCLSRTCRNMSYLYYDSLRRSKQAEYNFIHNEVYDVDSLEIISEKAVRVTLAATNKMFRRDVVYEKLEMITVVGSPPDDMIDDIARRVPNLQCLKLVSANNGIPDNLHILGIKHLILQACKLQHENFTSMRLIGLHLIYTGIWEDNMTRFRQNILKMRNTLQYLTFTYELGGMLGVLDFPKLKYLKLIAPEYLRDTMCIDTIARYCPNIEYLLACKPFVYDDTFGLMRKLKRLDLREPPYDDDGVPFRWLIQKLAGLNLETLIIILQDRLHTSDEDIPIDWIDYVFNIRSIRYLGLFHLDYKENFKYIRNEVFSMRLEKLSEKVERISGTDNTMRSLPNYIHPEKFIDMVKPDSEYAPYI